MRCLHFLRKPDSRRQPIVLSPVRHEILSGGDSLLRLPAYPAPPAPSITPTTSGLAIVSLLCGILFFIFPSAVAAIIFGHISRSDIRRSGGRKTGAGMALQGLSSGYIGVAIIPVILIIAAIAIPNLLRCENGGK